MSDPLSPGAWPALQAARLQIAPRVDFWVAGERVGSVAQAHARVLRRWPQWLRHDDRGLHLLAAPAARDAALAEMNQALRAEGLIVAWRDETFGLFSPQRGVVLATFERAACRFWGTLTRGAHCNGYVCRSADSARRPTHLWIARRSPHKATDPGLLDNLVGGGVPLGQTPLETVWREGWEEAGLDEARMRGALPGRVIGIDCDVPEGRMVEHIHGFDLELPDGLTPVNQDGEVAEIRLLSIEEATQAAGSGAMTTDAALVTLDFLLRHRLLEATQAHALAQRAAALWVLTDG
jgi:8-oxo-dGTP pyrophosphatase MutT (NUDIX family)